MYNRFKYKLPIYKGEIHIIFSDDFTTIAKEYRIDNPAFTEAYCLRKSERAYAAMIFKLKPSPGTVAHEVFHASSDILEGIGVHADHSNDEAQAYLIGWITDKVYDSLRKIQTK